MKADARPRKSRIALEAKPARAPAHESIWRKMLDRVKPLFSTPMDPRLKHLVAVFGEEAVRGLISAYRGTREPVLDDDAMLVMEETIVAVDEQPRGQHPAGSFVWHELMTSDVAGCERFYTEMFGWTTDRMEMMPGFMYHTFKQQGKDIAGMMAITPEQGEMKPGWTIYVGVNDVDEAATRAELLGGTIEVPPHDIPVGRWAMIRDPAGAAICLYRAKT